MEIRTFWRIIIKGIGLWFLINTLFIIPELIINLSLIDNQVGWNNSLSSLIFNILLFLIYIFFIRMFLFKSEWIIDTLKLEEHFTQKKIDIEISYETVLKIIIILIGALIFVEGLPNIARKMYQFLQQKELFRNYSDTTGLIYYFFKTLIGFLIMTNSKHIEKYINKETQNG